jgi:hypothetical protein
MGGGAGNGAGGGGGSGYFDPAVVSNGVLTAGSGPLPGNASDPDRAEAALGEVAGRLLLSGAFSTNAAPVAVNDSATTAFNTAVTLDPRTNDSDANGDTLAVTSIGAPTHGAAVVSNAGASITYTPTSGYSGSDTFTYTISDGRGGAGSASVNVAVGSNIAPVATNDSLSANPNVANVLSPLANDSDAEGQTLTVSAVGSPLHGSAVITSGGTTVTYTPTNGYAGGDTFSYTISDGWGGTASAMVNVTIVANPFYRPTFRIMKPGMSGASIGSSTFDIPAASGATALMSAPPTPSFSYEINMVAAVPSSAFVGVASQAWFDAGGQYSASTAGTAHWYVGYDFSYGSQSGTSAVWTAADAGVSNGDILGVTYSATTRKARIYLNGSLIGVLTVASSLAGVQMYPMIGSWAGRVAGSFRTTPSGYYSGYMFD